MKGVQKIQCPSLFVMQSGIVKITYTKMTIFQGKGMYYAIYPLKRVDLQTYSQPRTSISV